MSAINHANSSDGASAAASQLATSPFSPHANVFGPKSTMPLDASGRVHTSNSDNQSISSRSNSFTSSAHDHTSAPASTKATSVPTAHSSNAVFPTSPLSSAAAAPPSAGLYSFTDRIRNTSDHSRQSSSGAISNLSATSSIGAGAPLTSRLAQSSLAPNAIDQLGSSPSFFLNARSSTSLAPPTVANQQQRRLSSTSASHNDSPSLRLPDGSNGGARPPFGRQSLSDGPSSSAHMLLSADASSSSMDARSGSYSGSFPSVGHPSPLPQHASASAAGLYDPQSGINTPPAPTTGPLSASDPRTQLLVSNLPYRVRWQDLKDLFRKAGTVLRADVSLSADNRSRGYGTVLMATEQDAIKAADLLGGFTWQGRTLDVRVDRSGTLVGVAGSAVISTIASNAASSPSGFANGQPAPNPSAFSLDQNAGGQQFLGVPAGSFNAGSSSSPGSFSGAASPSALSQHVRATGYPQQTSSRLSFSAHPDAGQIGGDAHASELERAMLQGHAFPNASGHGTPNRQRPASNLDATSGAQAQHRAVSAVQSLASNPLGSRRGSDVGSAVGDGSPSPGLWTATVNDVASSMFSQNAGGSSVPTGFPGAPAMAPWPAGPGSFGEQAMTSMQSQPFGSQMPTTSYAGRGLFVGNLPFHCQWQDLKDLFRAAGNIQRADVAIGPDGRSRGFGTVLFASQEDAQNAVRLYHGYEYSGRTLKVHFDRFAAQNGPAVGTPGNPAQYTGAFAAAALPSHMTNTVRAPPAVPQVQQHALQGTFAQPHYSQQVVHQQQQRAGFSGSFGSMQRQGQTSFGQTAFQYLAYSSAYQPSQQQQQRSELQYQQRYAQQPQQMSSGFSAFASTGDTGASLQTLASSEHPFSSSGNLNDLRQASQVSTGAQPLGIYSENSDSLGETEFTSDREADYGISIAMPTNDFGAASSYLPSDLMSPGLVSPPAPTQQSQQISSHPGRIQLPATDFANSFGAVMRGAPADQMSPMTARMQIPMTPGMPGFTFQRMAETPPLYPQFLSPGLGAFGPTVGGSSQMGGGLEAASQYESASVDGGSGDYMNAASGPRYNVPVPLTPGAPIGYNPMFSTEGGHGSAHGVHQQPPATPHWSQPSRPRRGVGSNGTATRQSMGAPNPEADEVVDTENRAGIAKTPGAGPRRSSHVDLDGGHTAPSRRASVATPGVMEHATDDGYPFPVVAAGNVSHLTRRASMDSPAQTPLALGPAESSSCSNKPKSDSVPVNASTGEMLAGTSAEELAKTIARLSVKGTALAKESNTRRSLSMTAERSATASAMAKLREKAETSTPAAHDDAQADGMSSLGAAFAGNVNSAGATKVSSPLANSGSNAS